MILNEKRIVVTNNNVSPQRKIISAIRSSNTDRYDCERIDKNERIQLAINRMIATTVNSSIIVFSDLSSNFKEVRTIKQMPNKFEEAFNICVDFS